MTTIDADAGAASGGTWFRDEHATGPLPALQHGCWIEPNEVGFARSMARYGLPIAGLEHLLHRGWIYTRLVPLTDPAAVAERVATRLALPPRPEALAAVWWRDVDLPAWAARRRALRTGAETQADVELAATLVEVGHGLTELAEQRFGDIAIASLVGRWVAVAGRQLGLAEADAVALADGAPSPATTVLSAARTGSLADVVATHGDVLLGNDVLDPTLAEQADLLAAIPNLQSNRRSSTADSTASSLLDGADDEIRTALADARLSVQWRESTHDELCTWLGVLRSLALEAGRRLVAAGTLADAELALHLTVDELAGGLRGETAGLAARAEAQREAHEKSLADPPPPLLGPEPTGPPPAGGPDLPTPVAEALMGMAWVGMRLGSPPGPPEISDGIVAGVAAAPGTVTATVRVVLDLDGLRDLEPGEVLVCPTTAPGWDLGIAIAAAVVCDHGGLVSHAALLAREVGVPAVVGTKVGTSVLRTGQTIVVDGAAGTVTPA